MQSAHLVAVMKKKQELLKYTHLMRSKKEIKQLVHAKVKIKSLETFIMMPVIEKKEEEKEKFNFHMLLCSKS